MNIKKFNLSNDKWQLAYLNQYPLWRNHERVIVQQYTYFKIKDG